MKMLVTSYYRVSVSVSHGIVERLVTSHYSVSEDVSDVTLQCK